MTTNTQVTCKRRRIGTGFTLIELLVVVATISVLLAIFLPVLSMIRAQGKLTVCSSNLRQLCLAWHSYLADNSDRFYQGPGGNVFYGGWHSKTGVWPRVLNPYVFGEHANEVTERTAKVFCCPADRGGVPGLFRYMRAYLNLGTSYETNLFLVGPVLTYSAFSPYTTDLDNAIIAQLPNLTAGRVANPSRAILMGDYGWVNRWYPMDSEEYLDPELDELTQWHGKTDCHNVGFLDGHTAYTKILRGCYVADQYCVLPFKELYGMASEVQRRHEQER